MKEQTITLTGYLGHYRLILSTREVTRTVRRWNTVAEFFDEVQDTSPSRQTAILSLATHRWQDGRRVTTFHKLQVEDFEHPQWLHLRHARPGDHVEIEGTDASYNTLSEDGRPYRVRQILVKKLRHIE